jgi:hypothetical protein
MTGAERPSPPHLDATTTPLGQAAPRRVGTGRAAHPGRPHPWNSAEATKTATVMIADTNPSSAGEPTTTPPQLRSTPNSAEATKTATVLIANTNPSSASEPTTTSTPPELRFTQDSAEAIRTATVMIAATTPSSVGEPTATTPHQLRFTQDSAEAIRTATVMIAAAEWLGRCCGSDDDSGGHDRCRKVGRGPGRVHGGGMTVRPGGPSVSSFNGSPGPLWAFGGREATS